MLKTRCWSFFVALLLCSVLGFSQTAKKYFSAAEKFEQANNLKDAIDNYSKAIAADPAYEKAYTARALLYEKQNMKAEAVEDCFVSKQRIGSGDGRQLQDNRDARKN